MGVKILTNELSAPTVEKLQEEVNKLQRTSVFDVMRYVAKKGFNVTMCSVNGQLALYCRTYK